MLLWFEIRWLKSLRRLMTWISEHLIDSTVISSYVVAPKGLKRWHTRLELPQKTRPAMSTKVASCDRTKFLFVASHCLNFIFVHLLFDDASFTLLLISKVFDVVPHFQPSVSLQLSKIFFSNGKMGKISLLELWCDFVLSLKCEGREMTNSCTSIVDWSSNPLHLKRSSSIAMQSERKDFYIYGFVGARF